MEDESCAGGASLKLRVGSIDKEAGYICWQSIFSQDDLFSFYELV